MTRVTVIFVALFALASANPFLQERVADRALDSKIVGGSSATPGQFPYMVSLRWSGGSHFCGGSLITSTKVLTAAHCTHGLLPTDLYVVVGSNLLNSGGTSYNVARIAEYPTYNPNYSFNDVAVLILSSPVTLNANVALTTLNRNQIGGGVPCLLSGWGLTSYPGTTPNNLQWIVLNTINTLVCAALLLSLEVSFNQVCTFTRYGQGVCLGDSGSPLVNNGGQIGIVSWGIPCAKGKPDVFTRVSSYADWIDFQN